MVSDRLQEGIEQNPNYVGGEVVYTFFHNNLLENNRAHPTEAKTSPTYSKGSPEMRRTLPKIIIQAISPHILTEYTPPRHAPSRKPESLSMFLRADLSNIKKDFNEPIMIATRINQILPEEFR